MSGSLSSLLGSVPGAGASPALLALLAGQHGGGAYSSGLPNMSPLAGLMQPKQNMGQNPPAPMIQTAGNPAASPGGAASAGASMDQFAQLLKQLQELRKQQQQAQQQQGQGGASSSGSSGGLFNWLSSLFGGGGSTFTPSPTGTYGGQQVYTGPTNTDAPTTYNF